MKSRNLFKYRELGVCLWVFLIAAHSEASGFVVKGCPSPGDVAAVVQANPEIIQVNRTDGFSTPGQIQARADDLSKAGANVLICKYPFFTVLFEQLPSPDGESETKSAQVAEVFNVVVRPTGPFSSD